MSIAMRRKQQVEAKQSEPRAEVKPRRRRRILLVGGLVLAVLAWMLPIIIARTPLIDSILAGATAELNGSLAVESVSLGWFSSVVAQGVQLRDEQGRPVLEAAELTGNRSLLGILLNQSHLGTFELTEPKLTVVTRTGGSNLEDVLAHYLAPDDEPSEPIDFGLEIADGSITLTDQETGRTWQIDKVRLQLAISTLPDAKEPLNIKLSAEVPDTRQAGRLDVAIQSDEATIETDAVPLALLQSPIDRLIPQTRLGGRLSSKIHAKWDAKEPTTSLAVEGSMAASQLLLTTPALGTDQVELEQLNLSCRASKQGDRVDISGSSIDCDLGKLNLAVSIDLSDKPTDSSLPSALRQMCELTGRVDLARLAAMLPATLRIRQGTQITSGTVQVSLSSKPMADAPQGSMAWRGRIEADGLRGLHQGRPLRWDRPLSITLDAHDGPQGPIVKELRCDSDFFSLQAAGTPDQLAADATFNLGQLANQAGQFVDLDDLRLAGDGWGHFQWKRQPTGPFSASVEMQVRNFQLATSAQQPWHEDRLQLFLSAAGRTDLTDDTRVQQASLELHLGEEVATAHLTEPIVDFDRHSTWPIELHGSGRLEPWPSRLAIWLPAEEDSPGSWTTRGRYELNTRITGSAATITVEQVSLDIADLDLTMPNRRIREPSLKLTASGGWDRQTNRVQIDPISLTGNGLVVQGKNVVLAMPEDGPWDMAGGVGYRIRLERLADWLVDLRKPDSPRIFGELSGTAQVRPTAELIEANVDATVNDLRVALSSGEQFHEPELRLVADGDYHPRQQTLRLAKLQLSSNMLSANAAGSVRVGSAGAGSAGADDPTTMKLDGSVNYDLQKLSPMLRSYLGPQVRMTGTHAAPFFYDGRLDGTDARAGLDVAWDRADLYGLMIGPGQLQAKLANGLIETEPMDLAVSNGRLLLQPQLRLTPGPMELTLPPGPLARQVQITPAMCASMLKYIAPVLADVAAARGSFSVELDGCRVPLDDPATAELAGRLTVHSVEVGPGPLVRELAVLLGRQSPATLRRESQVQFRMVKGRVYHQGLELEFPELTIRTYGSVGLDQSLALMAEMPVPPTLLVNRTLDAALRNKIVKLPIGGTLSRPRIDQRELDRLSREFVRDAATNVITDELGRQLDRLFRPPQQRESPLP